MNYRQKHLINYLARKGVPMIIKTFPSFEMPKFTITKTDRFFRVNGKVVSKGMAIEATSLSA
jgi:hypothetical protein